MKMNLRIDPIDTSFFKNQGPYKNSHCFQNAVQLFNIIRDYFPTGDSKRLKCVENAF